MIKHVPTLVFTEEKSFVGLKTFTSLTEDQTYKLFSSFMPRRKEISNIISNNVFDIRMYQEQYHTNFKADNKFIKCAMMEVGIVSDIPDKMESLIIIKGEYAVFKIKHNNNDLSNFAVFEYIFTNWLPNSEYILDNRAHFDIFNEQYQLKKENSFYEIYIPVKAKL